MQRLKKSELIAFLFIAGYLIITLVVSIYQFRYLGGLTSGFYGIHVITCIVSVLLMNLKKQKNKEFSTINNIRSFAAVPMVMSLIMTLIFGLIEKGIVAIQYLF